MWPHLHPKRLIVVAGGALLFLGAALWWFFTGRPVQVSLEPAPRYVGDQSCRACHRSICDSFGRTAMGRAWYPPRTDDIIEDYSENNHVYDPRRDLHYEMIVEDEKFFQREYRLDEHGAVTHELVQMVSDIVGSGAHVRSYATESGGYLSQMPISWFTEKKKWDLSPGYESFNHRFGRPIVPSCVACHSSYPRYVEASLNRYDRPVPNGIGCERCHGPAEWHVRVQRDGWELPESSDTSESIVNPARLPNGLKDDVCFQCHLQGDVQFVFPGKGEFDFRPGHRLADYRSDFLAEHPDPDNFGIASHAVRMVQSRCYVASAGKMNCVTCHDPHIPLEDVQPDVYRQSCLGCHAEDSCRRVSDSSAADRTNDCVSCHMVRGQPFNVQHTVYTDHWIQRPRAERSATEYRRPTEFVSLRDFWGDERRREERLGMAHVAYAFNYSNGANLEHGIELLKSAANRNELHRDGLRKLGTAALVVGNAPLASFALERAIQKDPNDALARLSLGMALRALGEMDRALAQFEQTIQLAPSQLEAYREAANIYFERRQGEPALARLEESLRRNPAQPQALVSLAAVYCQLMNQTERGVEALGRAIELDPDDPMIRLALGQVFMRQNDLDAARAQLQHALSVAPDHVPALLTMARLHYLLQDKPQAVDCLRRVLRIDPQNPYARNSLLELGEATQATAPK